MTYQVHNIRAGSRTDNFTADTLAEAKATAKREASYSDKCPVWCDSSSWHPECALEPVGGYDLGDGDAVIIYEVV